MADGPPKSPTTGTMRLRTLQRAHRLVSWLQLARNAICTLSALVADCSMPYVGYVVRTGPGLPGAIPVIHVRSCREEHAEDVFDRRDVFLRKRKAVPDRQPLDDGRQVRLVCGIVRNRGARPSRTAPRRRCPVRGARRTGARRVVRRTLPALATSRRAPCTSGAASRSVVGCRR